jgi:hypothetical protein
MCYIRHMTYFAEIVILAPRGPESDDGCPAYRLPGSWPTRNHADFIASAHIAKFPRGSATWRVLNSRGIPVDINGSEVL